MSDIFRWCFIGTGTLANVVARTILPSGRHEIASVFTRRIEKAREFTEKYGGTPCDDAEAAIRDPRVDAVYVVTPHNSHHEYVKLALELGKPVLCEKPCTVDAAQTRELIELARARKIYLAEAMWTWFSPVARQVKRWVDAGEYGEIRRIVANYHMNSKNYAPRVSDPSKAGGALLDVGIYPITYLYRLFGRPVAVKCAGKLAGGVDLWENVELTFGNGKTFTASASIDDYKGLERFLIAGDKGRTSIWFFHSANKARLVRRHGPGERVKGDGGYLNEFDCVAKEIREGLTESRCVPLDCTLAVMEIMDECRRQMGLVYPFEKGKR